MGIAPEQTMRILFFVSFIVTVGILSATATDHRDGPRTTTNKHADILDLYSFVRRGGTKATDRGRLVFIMTAFPKAKQSSTHFGENVEYRFRVKRIAAAMRNDEIEVTRSELEDVVVCKAKPLKWADQSDQTQLVTCELNPGRCKGDRCITEVAFNARQAPKKGMRVYPGLVHDPFFSDVLAARSKRRLDGDETTGVNIAFGIKLPQIVPFHNRYALGLFVEVDLNDLDVTRSYDGLIGVVSETWVKASGTEEIKRWDRAGRVEVTNFLMCFRPIGGDFVQWLLRAIGTNLMDLQCSHDDAKLKDYFNHEDP